MRYRESVSERYRKRIKRRRERERWMSRRREEKDSEGNIESGEVREMDKIKYTLSERVNRVKEIENKC